MDVAIDMEEIMQKKLRNIEKVKDLHDKVMDKRWDSVAETFRYIDPDVQSTKLNKWGDTALHIAINTSSVEIVTRLVETIKATAAATAHAPAPNPLSVKNYLGDTPLHAAAIHGCQRMCQCIVEGPNSLLIKERNDRGETPLFLAAIYGHRDAFLYLFRNAGDEDDALSCCRRSNGDTVLHCTIHREYFDMSLFILDHCQHIIYWNNENGESPLQTFASTPPAFISGIHLNWWEKLCFHLFIYVGKFNHQETHEERVAQTKIKRKTHVSRFARILEKARRYQLGAQIMKRLIDADAWYEVLVDTDIRERNDINMLLTFDEAATEFPQARQQKRPSKGSPSSALLTATKHGATELVNELLNLKPYAIEDETTDKKNIVLVAIEARQTEILKLLMKHSSWNDNRLKYNVDIHRNNALHLAAKRSVNTNMAVSILHLQWEVSWFEYVKKLMPHNFINARNDKDKTPVMVFEEEHDQMLEKSDKWAKQMSGNYIVAATLISGVTFATAYQIPGGYKSENKSGGVPVIEPSTPAFRTFSLSALVSFCFSITSLAAFLSIYSSRIEYRQYRRILPLKLCLGLSALFISIVSMMLSFCAAHVFELNPKHKSKCLPLYAALVLIPLAFYTVTQFRLYVDLLRGSLSGVPVPRPFYMGRREETPPELDKEEENEREEEEEEEEEEDKTGTRKIVKTRTKTRTITRWRSVNNSTSH